MGRPRRENAGGGKENTDAQQQRGRATSRHASRPWDNLKPVRASLTASAARAFRDKAGAVPVAKASQKVEGASGRERARLPHERFTPLLRTTFSDESCTGAEKGKPTEVRKEENEDDKGNRVLGRHRIQRTGKNDRLAEADLENEPCSAPLLTVSREDTADIQADLLGPLHVHTLPQQMLRSMLPIPSTPPSPTRAGNRHSLRAGPAVQKLALSDDEGIADLGSFVDVVSERGGDLNTFVNDDFESPPSSEMDEDQEHPSRLDDEGNFALTPIDAMDLPSASPSLDGFRRSVRMSIRHSHVRTSDMRHSVRGAPVDHGLDLRQPSFREFEDDLIVEPPPLPEEISTSSETFSFERDFEESPMVTPQDQDSCCHPPAESLDDSADRAGDGTHIAFEVERTPRAIPLDRDEKLEFSIAPPDLQVTDSATRIITDGSEKPQFPDMTRVGETRKNDGGPRNLKDLKLSCANDTDDDGDVLDAPSGMTRFPDVEPAFRDLQRTSIKAGHELAVVAFGASTAQMRGAPRRDRVSRAQGELLLRSRFFRLWHSRFASVVDHAYFGAVLFLFCLDRKDAREGIVLKNSKMIVLADTRVQEVDIRRRGRVCHLLELKTSQRKYVFACDDKRQRDYWLNNFTRCEV
jgi:hypothetical protein